MNIKINKDSFGPWSIEATLVVDPKAPADPKDPKGENLQAKYLRLGALYEMERKPCSDAEKLFWTQENPKKPGEFVRGDFKRNDDIPKTDAAKAKILEVLEKAGYTDVVVKLRDVKEVGPAWKQRAKYLGELTKDGVLPIDVAKAQLEKLAAEAGVAYAEVSKVAGV